MKWVGMPEPTEEEIEQEVVWLIHFFVDFKRRNDRTGAKWRVGTTRDIEETFEKFVVPEIFTARSTWLFESVERAVQEIAEYHGMEFEGIINEHDSTIYIYTDRGPTMDERKQRAKDPLTFKQKIAFRKIKNFVNRNNIGPTKAELMKILGHRSAQSTKGILDILERKNWVFLREGQRRIELI